MQKVKVAVIGVGHLGSIHARIYSELENAELVAVCDIDKNKAGFTAEKYNTEAVFDYKKLLKKVDAASIVVPTNLHYAIAKDFIKNNTHLLIEKPITENLSQAEKLLKSAKKQKVLLQVGHIERFNAAIKAIEKIITKPKFIECHRLGPFKSRATDVGVVLDLMIHDIDIILHLVNSKIDTIDAVGVNVLSDHEDIANARIKFKNKAICNITSSRVSEEDVRKIRIFQKDAYVSLDYVAQEAQIYTKERNKITKENINIKRQEPLKAEIDSFLDCIIHNKQPIVSGEDATLALETSLQVLNKIKGNKKWIKK
jgi:predicted dehydrogenase